MELVRAPGGHVATAGLGRGPLVSERLEAIRSAALRLFATKGYRATTMADIGEAVGIRGPSLYKHLDSKQDLLSEIMLETMNRLIANFEDAIATTSDVRVQFRRAVEAHAYYHAQHRYEAFVGTRELDNLEEPCCTEVLAKRAAYERGFRGLIERGCAEGVFETNSTRLTSYSILDMGMGIAVWFVSDGPYAAAEIAYIHGDLALKMVGGMGEQKEVPGPARSAKMFR